MTTPKISQHARERCAEMEISTRVAKQIVQNGEVRYPGKSRNGHTVQVVQWTGQPDYSVVLDVDRNVVITVVFRTTEEYTRNGATFTPKAG